MYQIKNKKSMAVQFKNLKDLMKYHIVPFMEEIMGK